MLRLTRGLFKSKPFMTPNRIFKSKPFMTPNRIFKSKPILYNYKATNSVIGSFVMYNPTNYKLPSRMIFNRKNPMIFNRKLNNVINISGCTFLAGSLIFYIVNFVTFEFVRHFCHIYSLLWSIYFLANTNNAYVTLFIFGTSFTVLGIIIWYER